MSLLQVIIHVENEREADKVVELDPLVLDVVVGKPVENEAQDGRDTEKSAGARGFHHLIAFFTLVHVISGEKFRFEISLESLFDGVIVDFLEDVLYGDIEVHKIFDAR